MLLTQPIQISVGVSFSFWTYVIVLDVSFSYVAYNLVMFLYPLCQYLSFDWDN